MNQTLAHTLSMVGSANQTDWDRHFPVALFAYHVSPLPFFLLYGRQPRLSMEVSLLPPREVSASNADHWAKIVQHIEEAHRLAKENIQCAQQKMKEYYDHDSSPVTYEIGQSVWVYMPKKGPFQETHAQLAQPIHSRCPHLIVNFVFNAANNSRISTTMHVSCLKSYVDPSTQLIRTPIDDIDYP